MCEVADWSEVGMVLFGSGIQLCMNIMEPGRVEMSCFPRRPTPHLPRRAPDCGR